jgi:transketolase
MKPAGTPKRTGTTVARADVRQTNVRLTNARLSKADVTPVVFTHTFFVIVEGGENGASDQPVYQIQLWRVMVVHPVVDPNNKIPAKQT